MALVRREGFVRFFSETDVRSASSADHSSLALLVALLHTPSPATMYAVRARPATARAPAVRTKVRVWVEWGAREQERRAVAARNRHPNFALLLSPQAARPAVAAHGVDVKAPANALDYEELTEVLR